MVGPDQLSAAVVARLKADTTLTAALAEGATGVKEAQWRGTAFQYPAVRVERANLSAYGNGNCSSRTSRATFVVTAASKADSSKTAQEIQALIVSALDGFQLDTVSMRSTAVRIQLVSPAHPSGPEELNGGVWIGSVTFRTIVTEK